MVWLLLLLGVLADECPRYECSDEETQNCLSVSDKHVVLSQCPDDGVCPTFSMFHPENQTCVSSVKEVEAVTKCRGNLEEGDTCDENADCGEWLYCGKTRELESKCLPVVKVGKECQSSDMCRPGTLCHENLCHEYFSLPEGTAAQSKMVCESARLKNKECQPVSESIAPIPVMCNSDKDCRSTDDQYSKCVCALNSKSERYCTLHESDEPVKLFLEAVHNEYLTNTGELMLNMVYYPIFVNPEECFAETAWEFKELKQMHEWEDHCATGQLLAPFFVFLLS